jgi:hypothetical protein
MASVYETFRDGIFGFHFIQDSLVLIQNFVLDILSAGFCDGVGYVLADFVVVCYPHFIGHGDEAVAFLGIFPDGQAFYYEFVIDNDVCPGFDLWGVSTVEVDLDLSDVHDFPF